MPKPRPRGERAVQLPAPSPLLLLLFLLAALPGTAQVADSLFTGARDVNKSVQERVVLYDEIGFQTSAFDADAAVAYADTAVQLARDAGDSALVAFALNGKSIPYLRTGRFLECREVLESALRADTSDIVVTARILGKMASVEQELGQTEQALDHLLHCKTIFTTLNDSARLGTVLCNIGDLYSEMNEVDKSMSYLYQGLHLHQALGNPFGMGAAYSQLCDLYSVTEDLDSALHYAQSATQVFRDLEYLPEISSSLMTEGGVLRQMKRDEEGIEKYREAVEIAQVIGDDINVMFASNNIGNYYHERGQFQTAKPLFLRGIQIGEREGMTEKLATPYKFLSEIYMREGQADSSVVYRDKYEAALKARYNAEAAESFNEVSAKYEAAEQKATIAQQELELLEGEAIIAEQRERYFWLIGGVVVLVLAGLAWIVTARARNQVALGAAVAAEREKGFAQVVEATELERDRISKDLHDGIGQQLTALKLSLRSLGKQVGEQHEPQVEAVLDAFTQSAEEVRSLSHQMMPRMLMDFGLPEAVDDLLKSSFLHAQTSYEFQHKGLTERLDRNVEIAVYRVIQELINNALKHAEAKTFSVQLIRSERKLAGFILDDGKGFNTDHLSQGHGLQNMKNRLALIGGTLELDSAPGAGTSVSLSIPLS